MEEKKDIFDRIFSIPLLTKIQPFYKKYRELLLYLFFGGLTTIISIVIFLIFTLVVHCDELVANLISWIGAVMFAFVTNRKWVFQNDFKQSLWKQVLSFYMGRVATLIVEEIILLFFIKILLMNAIVVKVAAQIVVILLNYLISKLYIFKKEN